MKRSQNEKRCLAQLRESINEFQEQFSAIYSIFTQEANLRRKLSAEIYNNRHYWEIALQVSPRTPVGIQKQRKAIGYVPVEAKFPSGVIKGRLLYVERHEYQEFRHQLVLNEVAGIKGKHTKIVFNIMSVERIIDLKFLRRIGEEAIDFCSSIRTLERFPSEEKRALSFL